MKLIVEVHVHNHTNSGLEKKLDEALNKLNSLILNQKKEMKELDELQAQVAKTTSVEESAIVLLKGLKQKLDDAGTDPAKLTALSESLGAGADALAAAVVENTPATPAAE